MIDISICSINKLGEVRGETAALSPFFVVDGSTLNLQITTGNDQLTFKFPPVAVTALMNACNRYKIAHADTEDKGINDPTALPGRQI